MTIETSLNQSEREFLIRLYQETNGDENRQIDSSTIGITMGLDKAGSRKLSEELIGYGLATLKTLSGGIGITSDGLEEAQRLGGTQSSSALKLSNSPVIDADGCNAVQAVLADLKKHLGQTSINYDAMEELVIDIKTLDVQLLSPKPKRAVIEACFASLQKALKKARIDTGVRLIDHLMGPLT